MKDDLLDAQAAVDWAVAQIPSLRQRWFAWLGDEPYHYVVEPHPEMKQKLVKLGGVKPLPLIINAEVGAIINSLRSSLDILATSLGKRYHILGSNELYFPIANSEADFLFANWKGGHLIHGLPADARVILETVKPYPGGNDALIALHNLDITRKHRRLIDVTLGLGAAMVTPAMLKGGFGHPSVWPGFHNGSVVFWVGIDVDQTEFYFQPVITFDEAAIVGSKEVISALYELARLCEDIIKLFDR